MKVFSLLLLHLSLILVQGINMVKRSYCECYNVFLSYDEQHLWCRQTSGSPIWGWLQSEPLTVNTARKFSMGIPKFSMVSQFTHEGMEHKAKDTQSSLFSPIVSENSSSNFNGKDSSFLLGNREAILSGHVDASYSSLPRSEKGFHIDSSLSSLRRKNLHFSENSIVKDSKCFF